MAQDLLARLGRDGLLRADFLADQEQSFPGPEDRASDPLRPRPAASPPHLAVLRLCHRGALDGGLSAALDVRPDELVGPLCAAVGGSARRLKILDVRDLPRPQLRIAYGELEESWEVEDLYALVHNLNDLLRADPSARAVAVLGEWEDMLQLWCVRKAELQRLLRTDYFAPRNRHQLEQLAGSD
jgi:hypothetical protein